MSGIIAGNSTIIGNGRFSDLLQKDFTLVQDPGFDANAAADIFMNSDIKQWPEIFENFSEDQHKAIADSIREKLDEGRQDGSLDVTEYMERRRALDIYSSDKTFEERQEERREKPGNVVREGREKFCAPENLEKLEENTEGFNRDMLKDFCDPDNFPPSTPPEVTPDQPAPVIRFEGPGIKA